MCTGAEIALLTTAVVGTTATTVASNEAASEQREARRKEQNRQELQAARQRSQELRQAQIQRQRIVAASEAQGSAGSSPVAGGIGSLQTQAAENFAFSNQIQAINRGITNNLNNASIYGQQAQAFSAIANTATQAIGMVPGKAPTTATTAEQPMPAPMR